MQQDPYTPGKEAKSPLAAPVVEAAPPDKRPVLTLTALGLAPLGGILLMWYTLRHQYGQEQIISSLAGCILLMAAACILAFIGSLRMEGRPRIRRIVYIIYGSPIILLGLAIASITILRLFSQ